MIAVGRPARVARSRHVLRKEYPLVSGRVRSSRTASGGSPCTETSVCNVGDPIYHIA
jgi:hypothetical protein